MIIRVAQEIARHQERGDQHELLDHRRKPLAQFQRRQGHLPPEHRFGIGQDSSKRATDEHDNQHPANHGFGKQGNLVAIQDQAGQDHRQTGDGFLGQRRQQRKIEPRRRRRQEQISHQKAGNNRPPDWQPSEQYRYDDRP